MTNYLSPDMSEKLREIPTQALSHVGDAVFELMVRTYFCMEGVQTAGKLHSRTVKQVSAAAQAEASAKLLPLLTEEEAEIYRRGRNTHTRPAPKSATGEQYCAATAVETLFGYLYLSGRLDRLNELMWHILKK